MDTPDLFQSEPTNLPVAELLRPESLSEIIGQENIIGEGTLLRKMIESGNLSSFILWGPPGCGKTTIAHVISKIKDYHWQSFSAVISGIKEVKDVMQDAENTQRITGKRTVLFIDEIHRFNKAQQDAFLPYVEKGTIILIGATTENPSFSIISALLSRMRVFVLKRLKDDEISRLVDQAIAKLKTAKGLEIVMDENNKERIIKIAGGDARRCYGMIEMAIRLFPGESRIEINKDILEKVIQGRLPNYDKKNDYHYDTISALHKSMRNSDPDAALYYTVRMLESGEDPLYVIRRVIQFASEDVGLADPQALTLALAARETVQALGMPEAVLAICQSVVYNALAPKSNSLLTAYHAVKADINTHPDLDIPMQIRNAPTDLMKDTGYGKNYDYAHSHNIPLTGMVCLPDELADRSYYQPKEFGFEKTLRERMKRIQDIRSQLKDNS